MTRLLTAFMLGMLVLPLQAAEQNAAKAVIVAPEDPVPPGNLVTLDASSSVGTIFLWSANEPFPAPSRNWNTDSSQRKLYFATPLAPGRYAWTLAVVLPEAADDGDKLDQTQVVVTVGEPPPPPPPARLNIKLAKTEITENDGAGAASGTVILPTPVDADVPILLTVTPIGIVEVTPLVTIAAGRDSVGFLVDAIDNDEVDGTRVVVIEATAQNYESAKAELYVLDDESPPVDLKLEVTPTSFPEDGEGVGKLSRSGDLAQPLIVNLVSSDVMEATVPDSVSIPSGSESVEFVVAGVQDGEVDGDQQVTITATCQNCEPVSVLITVLDVDKAIDVKELWGVVVYESSDKGKYGPIINQVILARRLNEIENFTWLPFDKDQVDEDGNVPTYPVDFRPWRDLLLRDGLQMPYLFLIQQDGLLVDQMELPNSVDAVIAEVRKYLN